jgi:hypothetical protein
MSPSRREFIVQFGIALASLAITRCAPGTSTPEAQLRNVWGQLDRLAERTRKDADRGTRMRESLAADHRAALNQVVARGRLSAAAAGRAQVAFEAAAYHIWRANAPITCYEPVIIDFRPTTSGQLATQAALLAQRDDLDAQIVAQAQAAIARDIAFLNLPHAEVEALYQDILSAKENDNPLPAFGDVALELSPEDLEAAQFLVEALLGDAP